MAGRIPLDFSQCRCSSKRKGVRVQTALKPGKTGLNCVTDVGASSVSRFVRKTSGQIFSFSKIFLSGLIACPDAAEYATSVDEDVPCIVLSSGTKWCSHLYSLYLAPIMNEKIGNVMSSMLSCMLRDSFGV